MALRNKTILLALAALLLALGSCSKVNNKAVPSYPVRINLSTTTLWSVYGVNGVGDYRIFSRERRQPANFPYNANTFTGYGGVLLIGGIEASTAQFSPLAYDAACPVENMADVVLRIDPDNLDAYCPNCKSRFSVISGMGGPLSGQALTRKLALRTYHVYSSPNGGYVITNY